MPRIADTVRRRARPRQETDVRPPHLTRSQRKRIDAAIARANRSDRKETSAQESIPYERMWPDGICRVAAQYYTKTIQFLDINYQLNQDEDKTAIFEGWGDFLNYFDRQPPLLPPLSPRTPSAAPASCRGARGRGGLAGRSPASGHGYSGWAHRPGG